MKPLLKHKISSTNTWLYLFLGILLVLVLLNPFNGDVLVSFGNSIQADFLGNFPENVYHSWNLRGIGYKYFIYILYKITALITGKENFLTFQITAKFLYYSMFLTLSYFSFKSLKVFLNKCSLNWHTIFLVFAFIMLSLSGFCSLQAEEVGVFFTIFLTATIFSDKRFFQYLSGVFVCILLSLKIVTVFYAAYPALLLLYFYRSYKTQFARYLISSVISLLCLCLLYLFILPQEITDTLNATYFQSSLKIGFTLIYEFIYGTLLASANFPFLLPAIITFLILVFLNCRKKTIWFYSICLFLIPAIPILMQGKFFAYHYLLFVPFILIIYSIAYSQKEKAKLLIVRFFYTTAISVWLVFGILLWLFGPVRASGYSYYFQNKKEADHSKFNKLTEPVLFANFFFSKELSQDRASFIQKMDSEYNLSKESEILFLSSGTVNFFIHCKSYSRYYFPLPLQRLPGNTVLKNKSIYKVTYQQFLNYKGNYIIIESDWLKLIYYPELHNKILSEYKYIGRYGTSLYYLDLYKRK